MEKYLPFTNVCKGVVGMIVKYIGKPTIALEYGKLYKVLDQKHGFYQVMSELDETYYFPAKAFEIVESEKLIQSQ